MKDRGIAFAIVVLAIAVFLVGGTRPSPSQPESRPDQYLANDGKIFRFPGAAQGRVEVLEKNAQGKYEWIIQ